MTRIVKEQHVTKGDRAELRRFEAYLWRRAERPDEDASLAYAEVYGEVVFEEHGADEKLSGTDR